MSIDINPNKSFHVIIAAAGSGQRFESDVPKQYVQVQGKSILRHTIDNALLWPGLKSLRVIIDPNHVKLYENSVDGLDIPSYIAGGGTRKESICNALRKTTDMDPDDIVLVHDGARPLTLPQDVKKLFDALTDHKAATLAHRVSDTLRKSNNGAASDIVDRKGIWALQTPQAFYYKDLKAAHENTEHTLNATDDTSLISALGINVKLVEGSKTNIKITTQDDLAMMNALLSQNFETRTGMGYDVHAFEKSTTNRALILCGVEIEHPFALAGHSDADVGLHALTDALLGALGEGDIGQHFPPSDNTYKDMDSAIFLEKTLQMIKQRGASIINVDITLICEAPKIGPHRDVMRSRIASITNLSPERINIKATTTEKMGFTGRGEGIAANAIASIRIPV